jgi:uncharacterized membrane protein
MSTPVPERAALTRARGFSLRHRQPYPEPETLGDWLADRIAAIVGSWTFIMVQACLLVLWIVLNVIAWIGHWDPYPFILLNLVLSFQAAFTAPVLMMAQNREADIDRQRAQLDYDVNLKAELDIEALHHKVDLLRQEDITRLIGLIETLTRERIERGETDRDGPGPA